MRSLTTLPLSLHVIVTASHQTNNLLRLPSHLLQPSVTNLSLGIFALPFTSGGTTSYNDLISGSRSVYNFTYKI